MTPEQAKLKAKHGTPKEFEAAVMNSVGEISMSEARTAIHAYNREWDDAGVPENDKTLFAYCHHNDVTVARLHEGGASLHRMIYVLVKEKEALSQRATRDAGRYEV